MTVSRRTGLSGLLLAMLVLLVPAPADAAQRYVDMVKGTSGLTGYWRLGESFGTTAVAERGPNGTYRNAPFLGAASLLKSDGNFATDFTDDGTHEHIGIPGPATDFTTAFSMEAWIRVDGPPPTTQDRYVFCKGGAYAIGLNSENELYVIFVRTDGAWLYTDTNPEDRPGIGQPLHVVGTYDGAKQNLYINGRLADSEPYSGQVKVTTNELNVGGCNGWESWEGVIDEPAIYNRALTAAEVSAHFDAGDDGTPPAAPAGLKATPGDRTVQLDWQGSIADADVESYVVYRSTSPGATTFNAISPPLSLSEFTDKNLSNGTSYEYFVQAEDKHGNAATSTKVVSAPVASTRYRDVVSKHPSSQFYWRLADAPGSTTVAATQGNSGTLYGAPVAMGVPGLLQNDSNAAFDFDGVDDYVVVPDHERLDVTDALTLEAWIRPDALTAGNQHVLCKEATYCIAINSAGLPHIGIQLGATWMSAPSASALALGQAYHLVGTYDGRNLRLYVNGTKVSDQPMTGTIAQTNHALNIGAWANHNRFNGIIDEPAIYDAALTAAEVRERFETGRPNAAPAAPGGVIATTGDGLVALDWADNAEADVAGYDVYRSGLQNGAYTKLNERRLTASRFTDFTAANGRTHFYVVRAVNKAGAVSANSAQVNAKPRAGSSYRQSVVSNAALRGYWRLDETNGGTAAAEVGPEGSYENHPVLGRPGLLRSEANGAPEFSAVAKDTAVSIPDGPVTDLSNAYTLEAWIKPTAVRTELQHVICKGGGAYKLRVENNRLQAVMVRDDGTWTFATAPTVDALVAGQTYHVAATYDGAKLDLYMNARLVASTPLTGLVRNTTNPLNVGACNNWEAFHGIVDEAAIYGVGLTAAQLKEHYDLGVDATAPARPGTPTVVPGNGTVSLDWADNAETDLNGYDVLRSTTAGGPYTKVNATRLTTSSFSDTDLVNGRAYFYVVKAWDKAGNASTTSVEARAVPTGGTVFHQPQTLHANGADLHWSKFAASGETFDRYELHRVYNGASTLLATIRDGNQTTYRDTTAGAGRTYTYRLRTNGAATGEWTVTLPAEGQARKSIQLDGSGGQATYFREGICANRGLDGALRVGTAGGRVRGLIGFDLADIPADATISSATMSLYASAPAPAGITVEARRAAAGWAEGTGRGWCSGDGATWSLRREGADWQSAGGDADATVVGSATQAAGAAPGWDSFDITSAVRAWAGGQAANTGLQLRASDETAVEGKLATYVSDEGVDPTLRPKLTVAYTEPSVKAQGPVVDIGSHVDGEVVSGGAVKLAANATDDSQVSKVEFLVDGALKSTDTSAPFEYASWSTTGLTNGAHTVSARATDDAGNATTSPAVSLTVDNTAPPTAAVALPKPGYAATVKADNPIGFYRLNESAGATVAADSSGGGRNAAYHGTTYLGQPGLTKDGDTGVRLPKDVGTFRSSALGAGVASTQKVSVELWTDFKGMAADDTYDNLAMRGWGEHNTYGGRWVVFTTQWDGMEHVCFNLSTDDVNRRQVGACGKIEPGRRHVVGTYDGKSVRMHVDGMETEANEFSGITLDVGNEVKLNHGSTQDLTLDDFALYNAALSGAQVQQHYDAAGRDATYVNAVKADGPSGLWQLGETSGTAVADSSGNNRGGTLSGNVSLNQPTLLGDGTSNPSTMFLDDAAGDGKVSIPGLTGVLGSRFTAEAWIETDGPMYPDQRQAIMSRGWGAAGGWQMSLYESGTGTGYREVDLKIDDGVGGRLHARATVQAGRIHVVANYDGTKAQIYVDGSLVTEQWYGGLPLTTTAPLVLGGSIDSGRITIDDAAVYDKILTRMDVRDHFVAGRAPAVTGTPTVTAATTGTVKEVDFYVDGQKFGSDADGAPYNAPLPTLGSTSTDPTYDGTHAITTKVYDANGQVTTSAASNVAVENTEPAAEAGITSSQVPPAMTYDPAAATQESHAVDVAVQNTGDTTLTTANTAVRARWVAPDGTTPDVPADTALSASIPPGDLMVTRVNVKPPQVTDHVHKAKYQLQLDLLDKTTGKSFSANGNKPAQAPVTVTKKDSIGLGLERFYHYDGVEVGAGVQNLVNLASANNLLRWTPFSSPGRGISTVLDLTYNALEDKSESPIGNNFSLSISGLTRFGAPLDIHPNDADTKGGKASSKWVGFTDGDGTTHRFEGKLATDGVTTVYQEPAGVNLYLRPTGSSDFTRRWAVTRPDRTTFLFDGDGYPTAVEDGNGNRLTFVIQAVPPGEDPGGPKKRITAVRDAGGRNYTIEYYSKSDVKKAHVRGKIKRILDHTNDALEFEYYQDGNLRRIIQKGGARDGMTIADRRITFTYTTSSGAGPAIGTYAARREPEARTSNQSTRLYSVIDARGGETTFTYVGPGGGQDRWRLKTRTDRLNRTTTFTLDGTTRTTTVARPLSRTTKHVFDAQGSVTAITNPKNETTDVAWTADRKVSKVTEPLNPETGRRAFVSFTYDQNGYLLDQVNEMGEKTELRYDSVAVDANDVSGKWPAGRTQGHISQLRTKTDPKGVATPTNATDYQWSFDYDAKGNVTRVTDPEQRKAGKFEQVTYDTSGNGDIRVTTDANGKQTKFDNYDANGLALTITDPLNRVTRFTYDGDGLITSTQDPRHASNAADARSRTQFYYDAFQRMRRQSSPKSTEKLPGTLIWTGAEFDENDNVVRQVGPHVGPQFTGGDATTGIVTRTYDAMDRQRTEVGPDATPAPGTTTPLIPDKTTLDYDDADRLQKATSPKGNQTARADDFATSYDYDVLDRPIREVSVEHNADGTVRSRKRTHHCYDVVGNLRSTTAPNANVDSVTCSPYAGAPHTTRFTYDDAHRRLATTDPEGRRETVEYDLHGNVWKATDANNTPLATPRKAVYEYDERDLLIRAEVPFDDTGRKVVTRSVYDAAGQLTKMISPRAHDASGGAANVTDLVTLFDYDDAGQLVKETLPKQGTETPAFIHRRYDANGNAAESSLPTKTDLDWRTAPTLAAIDAKLKTTSTFFDPGWVSSTTAPGRPTATFDYTPEGWQQQRVTPTRTIKWSYDKDGQLLLTQRDDKEASKKDTYTYDANNNLLTADNTIGADAQIEKPISVKATYDGFDRAETVTSRKENEHRRITELRYDVNDNVIDSVQNKQVSDTGTVVKKGRHEVFTYDTADWVKRQVDEGKDGDPNTSDDREILTAFTNVGLEKQRRINKYTSIDPVSGKPRYDELKQQTDWTHFHNGKLKSLITKTGSGEVKESHDVEYVSNGVYLNGHRAKDTYVLKGPAKAGAKCQGDNASGLKCSTRYTYDARDRLTQEDRDRVGASDTAPKSSSVKYTLDVLGNVTQQDQPSNDPTLLKTFPDATEKIQFDYSGTRLTKQTATITAGGQSSSSSVWSWYDPEGNLSCQTKADNQSSLCKGEASSHNASVVGYNAYDSLDRLLQHKDWSYGSGAKDRDSTYAYDALDRIAQQTEKHGSTTNGTGDGPGDPRTTVFTYLGLTDEVTEEREKNTDAKGTKTPSAPQETRSVRDFAYDPFGNRVGMSKTDTASSGSQSTTDYTYGHDVHGSVSLLVDSAGASKARYGYSAYGECDNELTNEPNAGETPDTAKSECDDTSPAGTDRSPLNPYRYNDRRFDTGSGTVDMGARRFSPDTGRFQQEDYFEDALGDLELSDDPLTGNRYSLAGGNPVSFVETDGHMVRMNGGGGGSTSPRTSSRRRTGRPTRRSGSPSAPSASGGSGSGSSTSSGNNVFEKPINQIGDSRWQLAQSNAAAKTAEHNYWHEPDPNQSGVSKALEGELNRKGTKVGGYYGGEWHELQESGVGAAARPVVKVASKLLGAGKSLSKAALRRGAANAGNAARQYRSFRPENFRHNLKIRTGKDPGDAAQAHHVFPKNDEMAAFFRSKGIEPNNPKFGTWWQSPGHNQAAQHYNRQWRLWIQQNPNASQKQVLSKGKDLMKQFGQKADF